MTYTLPSNYTNVPSLLSAVDTMVGGYFGACVVLMIFLITFLSLKGYSSEKAFTTACYVTLFSAILLSIMGVIDAGLMLLPAVALAFSIFFLKD